MTQDCAVQINLKSFFCNQCVLTIEEGDAIYNIIYPLVLAEKKVAINLSEQFCTVCGFYHASVGRLLKDFCEGKVREFVIFKNADADELHKIDKIIKNAVNWYSPDHERRLLQSLEDMENDRQI